MGTRPLVLALALLWPIAARAGGAKAVEPVAPSVRIGPTIQPAPALPALAGLDATVPAVPEPLVAPAITAAPRLAAASPQAAASPTAALGAIVRAEEPAQAAAAAMDGGASKPRAVDAAIPARAQTYSAAARPTLAASAPNGTDARRAKKGPPGPRWKTSLLAGTALGVAAPVLWKAAPVMMLGFTVPSALTLAVGALVGGSLALLAARKLLGARLPTSVRGKRAVVAASLSLGLFLGAAPTLYTPQFVRAAATLIETAAPYFEREDEPIEASDLRVEPLPGHAGLRLSASLDSTREGRELVADAAGRVGTLEMPLILRAGPQEGENIPFVALDAIRVGADGPEALKDALVKNGGVHTPPTNSDGFTATGRNLRPLGSEFRDQVAELLMRNPEGRKMLDGLRDRGGALRLPDFYTARLGHAGMMSFAPLDAILIDEEMLREDGFGEEIHTDAAARRRMLEKMSQANWFHELYHAVQLRSAFPTDLSRDLLDQILTLPLELEAHAADALYTHAQLQADPHAAEIDYADYVRFLDDLEAFLQEIRDSKTYERFVDSPSPRYDAFIADLRARWPQLRLEGYRALAERFADSNPARAAEFRRKAEKPPEPEKPAPPPAARKPGLELSLEKSAPASPGLGERVRAALDAAPDTRFRDLAASRSARYVAVARADGETTYLLVDAILIPKRRIEARFGSVAEFMKDPAKQRQLVNEELLARSRR